MPEVLVPISFFVVAALIVWSILFYNNKNKALQQTTIQKLIDSGQVLSPEILESITKPAANESNNTNKDFSRGVVLVSFALALFFFGWLQNDTDGTIKAIGVFPLFIGIAYLVINKFRSEQN